MILRRTHEMVGGDLGTGLARSADAGNAILSLRTQVADYALEDERMALLCAWNGRQEVALDGRRVFVDDDTWLTVPAASTANVRIRGPQEVHALTILFRRGMPEEVLGSLVTSEDRLLDNGEVRPLSLKVGDSVLFGQYSGNNVKVDGQELIILTEGEVFGVIEK